MSEPGSADGSRRPDHVLGVFSRERLSEALSATHRAGFGPNTRVLDGQRSSTASQLSRAGLAITQGPAPAPDDLVILVQAPGRVDRVAELFHQLGAQLVAQAQRSAVAPAQVAASPLLPDVGLPASGDVLPGASS